MIDYIERFLEDGEKLICFGDSLTAQNVYVEELRRALPKNVIVNAGRGGDKTPYALTRFQQDVLDREPDALLLFFGANDAAIGRGKWADEPMVSAETYCTNLVWMVHLARMLKQIRKIAIATPLGSFEGDAYRMHGDILRDYCLAARKAASICKVPLVPLDACFWENRPQKPLTEVCMTVDGTHPTEEMYLKLAHAMLKAWNMDA